MHLHFRGLATGDYHLRSDILIERLFEQRESLCAAKPRPILLLKGKVAAVRRQIGEDALCGAVLRGVGPRMARLLRRARMVVRLAWRRFSYASAAGSVDPPPQQVRSALHPA